VRILVAGRVEQAGGRSAGAPGDGAQGVRLLVVAHSGGAQDVDPVERGVVRAQRRGDPAQRLGRRDALELPEQIADALLAGVHQVPRDRGRAAGARLRLEGGVLQLVELDLDRGQLELGVTARAGARLEERDHPDRGQAEHEHQHGDCDGRQPGPPPRDIDHLSSSSPSWPRA
jgi:hypothetical protein